MNPAIPEQAQAIIRSVARKHHLSVEDVLLRAVPGRTRDNTPRGIARAAKDETIWRLANQSVDGHRAYTIRNIATWFSVTPQYVNRRLARSKEYRARRNEAVG